MRRLVANTSPEAIKLRKLAQEFGEQGEPLPTDLDDVRGQRLNIALLAAARAYARVADMEEAEQVASRARRLLADGSARTLGQAWQMAKETGRG